MIRLTAVYGGEERKTWPVLVNPARIEYVVSQGDGAAITFTSGRLVVVAESLDQIHAVLAGTRP